MQGIILRLQQNLRALVIHEEGQDLVEYGLLVSLIALAAIASTNSVANAITTIFNNISTTLA
jgi:Flp pilus assembly pilin Flp